MTDSFLFQQILARESGVNASITFADWDTGVDMEIKVTELSTSYCQLYRQEQAQTANCLKNELSPDQIREAGQTAAACVGFCAKAWEESSTNAYLRCSLGPITPGAIAKIRQTF